MSTALKNEYAVDHTELPSFPSLQKLKNKFRPKSDKGRFDAMREEFEADKQQIMKQYGELILRKDKTIVRYGELIFKKDKTIEDLIETIGELKNDNKDTHNELEKQQAENKRLTAQLDSALEKLRQR